MRLSLLPLAGSAIAAIQLRSAVHHADSLVARAYPDEALRCIQVDNPVLLPTTITQDDETIGHPAHQLPSCQQVIVKHTFGNSYGQPYVGASTLLRPPNP